MEGAFAISPIVNYLLASFGFLLLFGWAALGGMFHDIEQPKYTMLENEARLDQQDDGQAPPFVERAHATTRNEFARAACRATLATIRRLR